MQNFVKSFQPTTLKELFEDYSSNSHLFYHIKINAEYIHLLESISKFYIICCGRYIDTIESTIPIFLRVLIKSNEVLDQNNLERLIRSFCFGSFKRIQEDGGEHLKNVIRFFHCKTGYDKQKFKNVEHFNHKGFNSNWIHAYGDQIAERKVRDAILCIEKELSN